MTSNSHMPQAKPTFSGRHNAFCRPQHRLAALACALAVGHPAVAMAAGSAREVVTYADLDLAAASGARELSERVLRAAKRVCVRSRLGSGIDQMALHKACVADTYRDAVARFNSSHPSGAFVLQVRRAPYRASLSTGH